MTNQVNFEQLAKLQVESASGGKQTVVFTPKGQPCYMTVINRIDIEKLDPEFSTKSGIKGPHPAFKVGNKVHDRILIGTYPSSLSKGELVSQPNAAADYSLSLAQIVDLIKSQGAGWHCLTPVENHLIQCLSFSEKKYPLGANSKMGFSTADTKAQGRRVDGKNPQDFTELDAHEYKNASKIYTGSGPLSFRHDHKYSGISDIVNGWGWHYLNGSRLIGNELQVYVDAPSLESKDLNNSTGWKAIDATTGAYITPEFTGSIETQDYVAVTNNSVRAGRAGEVKPAQINLIDVFFNNQVNWHGSLDNLPNLVRLKLVMHGLYPNFTQTSALKPIYASTFYYSDSAQKSVFILTGRECTYQSFVFMSKDHNEQNLFNQCTSRIVIHETDR